MQGAGNDTVVSITMKVLQRTAAMHKDQVQAGPVSLRRRGRLRPESERKPSLGTETWRRDIDLIHCHDRVMSFEIFEAA